MSTSATPQQTLAELAVIHPAASRVFHRNRLDFCCHGQRPLAEAAAERGLDAAALLAEIEAEQAGASPERWDGKPVPELIRFIVDHYHARLRAELPELQAMAERVETVHADKASRPRGLAAHLRETHLAVLDHLAKEEQVLFPLILDGRGAMAAAPVRVLEAEHDDHAAALRRIRELAADLEPPAEACTTWKALYLRLEQLEAELMEHIHLENNVLFRRVLGG
jgi:regulator of cell morphogenesis and NO signaling